MAEPLGLSDLSALPPPAPWSEGDNIPWNEPGFSARMLDEHLSQAHDAASRRFGTIGTQVEWIHHRVLEDRATPVLDLGCGPGFYAARLAALGHECVGIDYSPASIAYALEQAGASGLTCEYRCEDIRRADFGEGYGLVMLIFGELNVFRPSDAKSVLVKARRALRDEGRLLLEPHTFDAIKAMGSRPRHWYFAARGLFSDEPHLFLQEQRWDAETSTTTRRYVIVEAGTGEARVYGQTFQAYSEADYRSLLGECGFRWVEFHASLTGTADDADAGLCAIVASTT